MKPGNRVEGKTLRTREGRAERTLRGGPAACDGEHTSDPKEAMSGAQAWVFQWRRWNTGSRGREAVVTAAPSRDRDGWRNQKTHEGIPESQQRHRPEDVWEVWRGPVLGPEGHEHPGNRWCRKESRRSH